MRRRDFLTRTAAFAAAGGMAGRARAQEEWPQRQVTIVVPFSAGGSADLLGRLLAQHLQAKFGVPFVVENRGGAGGSIGTAVVAKAPPDGYTLLIGTVSTHAITPSLYAKLPFDIERDFAPISLLVRLPNLLIVNKDVPAKTVPELVDYLKANDGKVNFGSSGNGTSSHLAAVMFQLATGTRMTHVPFRSTSEEMNNMMGGHIQLAIDSMTTIWPLAKSGEVRAVAVSTPERVAAAPDVPTIGETIKGFEATGWQGLYAPAATPRAIVDKIAAEVKRIFGDPGVKTALENVGGEPAPMTPEAFAAFARTERAKWAEVVKAAGVRIE
ncbi:MAG TPA: tripartite tricarboxylate transporter substrate binding protein [Xanthobacteraceae bacterium]|jgi:tripartite-type tricarboxylate transporter receptor subunit TctC